MALIAELRNAVPAIITELRAARERIAALEERCRPVLDIPKTERRCGHDRLNEDGICRACGADRRGI